MLGRRRSVRNGPDSIPPATTFQTAQPLVVSGFDGEARAVGLQAANPYPPGWSTATAGNDLLTIYQEAVRRLVTVTTPPPAPLPRPGARPGQMARLPSAGASHPGVIQVGGNGAAADLHEHPVVCPACGKPFTP